MGLQLSLSSLALGHRTALCVHRWLLPEGGVGRFSPTPAADTASPPLTVPASQSNHTAQNPAAAASQNHARQADQTAAFSQRCRQSADGDGDNGMPQSNGSVELGSVAPWRSQPPGAGDANGMPAQHAQPGLAVRSNGTEKTQSNGRLRPSLEELEEGMPDAAAMDEETREDKFLERASAGAVRWCGASRVAPCENHARLDGAIGHPELTDTASYCEHMQKRRCSGHL